MRRGANNLPHKAVKVEHAAPASVHSERTS
jgi:hypothetical protein